MGQHDTPPGDHEDLSHEDLSREDLPRPRPLAEQRPAVLGAIAVLLVLALSITLFASLSNQRAALGAAAGTPTACPPQASTPTATAPTPTVAETPKVAGAPTAGGTPTVEATPEATTEASPQASPSTTEGTPTVEATPGTSTPTPACTPAARTPTAAPTRTVGKSTVQAPKHGAGLPAGVALITFALTGPDEGWGTGGVITNPVSGYPDRGMVLHYAAGAWTQVGGTLPGAYLGGLDMVSSSEGWAMGGTGDARSLLLHIRDNTWQQVTLPGIDPGAAINLMAMRTPDEGWVAVANPKGTQGALNTSLLHAAGGTWTPVPNAPYFITDIAPVADGEAWVIGENGNGTSSLVHVRGGAAEVELTSPGNSTFSRLRMFAPNDIWIEGAMHASTNAEINDVPLVYHFDGAAWANVNLHVPHGAQHVGIVASDTTWSFVNVNPKGLMDQTPYGQVASIYTNTGGSWQALSVPYDDLQSLKVVSTSSTDVWAIGTYLATTQLPDHNGAPSYSSVSRYVLLHYSDGGWTEYGR